MRSSPPPPDYFLALEAKQRKVSIEIAGKQREITRARLGRHYGLQAILNSGSPELADQALDYIALAAGCDPNAIQAEEIGPAFEALMELNNPMQVPAIVRHIPKGGRLPAGLKYNGRFLANMVHEFAYRYGWSADYTLNELGPEEALCYLQEIINQVHQDRAFEYSLSSVGRDKRGKQRSFPEIDWLRVPYENGTDAAAPARPVPVLFRPVGEIVRLGRSPN